MLPWHHPPRSLRIDVAAADVFNRAGTTDGSMQADSTLAWTTSLAGAALHFRWLSCWAIPARNFQLLAANLSRSTIDERSRRRQQHPTKKR